MAKQSIIKLCDSFVQVSRYTLAMPKRVHPSSLSNGVGAKYASNEDDDDEKDSSFNGSANGVSTITIGSKSDHESNGQTVLVPMSVEEKKDNDDEDSVEYEVYGKRWLILASILMLNLANYSGWISFAAVTSKAAQFYQVSDSQVREGHCRSHKN